MTEESLRNLPINDLFDLMVKNVNELLELHKRQEQQKMVSKTQEVELIQRVIVEKRAEFPPLK